MSVRAWFGKLALLVVVVLPLILAACNRGPGLSGGPPGY